MPRKYEGSIHGTTIQVKCPCCGKFYTRKMIWIGRGTPRIYCHGCANNWQHNFEPAEYDPHSPQSACRAAMR